MKKKYSLILPCYNEYENLRLLIPEVCNSFKKLSYELIIVDDNSEDLTIFKLKKLFRKRKNIKYILRKNKRSLGLSIKEGILKSNGANIIVMDSDFNHTPKDLIKMIKKFETNLYDLVCGSRFIQDGYSSTFFRHHSSKLFNFYVNFITGGKLSDNLSGFFIIKRKYLNKYIKKIFFGYGDFYIRLLYVMQKIKISIAETSIKYSPRKYGESKSRLINMMFSYSISAAKIVINKNLIK